MYGKSEFGPLCRRLFEQVVLAQSGGNVHGMSEFGPLCRSLSEQVVLAEWRKNVWQVKSSDHFAEGSLNK